MARGLPLRSGSFCCSIEAKAQLRSTTRVVGGAVLSPRSRASTYRCSHPAKACARVSLDPKEPIADRYQVLLDPKARNQLDGGRHLHRRHELEEHPAPA